MFAIFPYTVKHNKPLSKNVKPFQRAARAGVVVVKNWKPNMDLKPLYIYPPSRVTDLRFTFRKNIIMFTWTAVGDYLEEETGKDGQ